MGKIYRYGRWIEVDDEDLFSGPYDHPEYFDRQQWVDLAGGGASDATAQGDVCPMSTSRAHKPSLAEERTEPERAALMGMIVSVLSSAFYLPKRWHINCLLYRLLVVLRTENKWGM